MDEILEMQIKFKEELLRQYKVISDLSGMSNKAQEDTIDLQEEISLEIQSKKVGKTMKVIIDSEDDEYYTGRTEFDSPEVDPEVLIKKDKKIKIGDFYNVKITNASPFELFGEVAD